MLLCSPVSVSLCLHLLGISDLLFFSTRAPQPSLVSHCLTIHILALFLILPFMLYAPCPFNAPFLFYVFQLLHTPPSTLLNPSQQQQPPQLQQQQQPHLFSVPCTYSFCAPCACNVCNASACSPASISSTSRVLCLIIMVTLQLLWRFSHTFSITGCYAKIPQPLWQLRLFVFSGIVELILYVSVTGSNPLPAVNRLYDQSPSLWKIPRDSSAPLEIIQKSLRILW
jgi:hypothetical protein